MMMPWAHAVPNRFSQCRRELQQRLARCAIKQECGLEIPEKIIVCSSTNHHTSKTDDPCLRRVRRPKRRSNIFRTPYAIFDSHPPCIARAGPPDGRRGHTACDRHSRRLGPFFALFFLLFSEPYQLCVELWRLHARRLLGPRVHSYCYRYYLQ